MQNPRVQECIAMMQKDPTAAKKKFEDDKEVMKYMEEFSRLMGTHFDLMAIKESRPIFLSKPAGVVGVFATRGPVVVGLV